MNFSFPADKQIEFTFRVGIAGTQTSPSMVAVVLERGDTALSFVARQAGDEWKAIIESPGTVFGLGQVKLNINVILNNRLFTPMKGTAEIVAEDNITVDVTIPALDTKATVDTPIPPPVATEVKMESVETAALVEVVKPVEIIKEKLIKADPTVKQAVHSPKVVEAVAPKPVPKVEVKKVIEKAKVIPAPIVEKVEISQPVRMQLLKSIEPGNVHRAPKVMESSLIAKKPEQLFTLKRTKIISK